MTEAMGPSGGTAARIMKRALSSALKAAWHVIRAALPASLLVAALRWLGFLEPLSAWLEPAARRIGLPGGALVALAGSSLFNVYAGIALAQGFGVSGRAFAILAIMSLTSRGLPAETALMKKTGSSALKMIVLRLAFAAAAGFLCNLALPYSPAEAAARDARDLAAAAAETESPAEISPAALAIDAVETDGAAQEAAEPAAPSFWASRPPVKAALMDWGRGAALLLLEMIALVALVAVLQKVLDELGFMRVFARGLSPLLRVFGLPRGTDALWVVMQAVGYAYGASILEERITEGEITRQDGDLLNHHAALCHSLLEDTVLFAAFGAPGLLISFPRVAMAVAVTWLERARRYLFKRSFRVGTV